MSGFARAVLNCGRLVIAMAAAPFRNARRDAAVIEATSPRRSDVIASVIVDLPGLRSQSSVPAPRTNGAHRYRHMPQEKFSQSQAPHLHCSSLPPPAVLDDGQLNLSPRS